MHRVLILSVLFSLPGLFPAQAEPGIITIESTGSVSIRPDQATITVGVEVDAATAEAALRDNSINMAALFAVLDKMQVPREALRTTQLSVYPRWDNRRNSLDGPLEVIAFVATNTLEIHIDDLERLGTILDALIDAGANRIHGVQFGVGNPQPSLDEARRRAVAEANRRAALYAEAAGLTLGAIRSLSESGRVALPALKMEAMALEGVPVAEGSLTISATITVTYGLGAAPEND